MLEPLSVIGVLLCLWVGALVLLCDEEDIALSLRITFYSLCSFVGLILSLAFVRIAWAFISAA